MNDLIAAAHDAIRRAYREPHHTVGAAVRVASGAIFTGVNLDCSAFGPCAEPIALGAAIAAGEPDVVEIVAVQPDGSLLPPCGNCRQLFLDLAPNAVVLIPGLDGARRVPITQLLPDAYRGGWNDKA